MPVPSVKTLSRCITCSPSEGWAKKLHKLCERFDHYQPEISDSRARYILTEASEIMGFFETEYIAAGSNANSTAIHYVNTGDPYKTTLMIVDGKFRVGCWGDIVERGNYA